MGFRSLEFSNWTGLFAPAGTPDAIIEKRNAEVKKAMNDPSVAARLTPTGIYPGTGTPEQLREHVKREIIKWQNVVKTAQIKAEI